MKNLKYFTLALVFLTASAEAQYQVIPCGQILPKGINSGIYYNLPAQGISINITLTKTNFQKGIYAPYAENLLGIQNAIKEDSQAFEISGITIDVFPVADSNESYFVYGKGSFPSLEFTPWGTLAGVNKLENSNRDRRKKEYAPSDFKETFTSETPKPVISSFIDLNTYEKFDTILKEVKLDSTYVVQKTIKSDIVQKTEKQKADEIAKLFSQNKEKRMALISGNNEVNYSPQTIEFMYETLLKEEADLLKTFTGNISTEEIVFEFQLFPSPDSNSYTLAHFCPQKGLSTRELICENEQLITLKLQKDNAVARQVSKHSQNRQNPKNPAGFYYKIPASVFAQIEIGGKNRTQKKLKLSQWGESVQLPNGNFRILLDSVYGEIISIDEALNLPTK